MVERNDRRDRISETEGRKENKLLYFIVQTIGCNSRLADASENNVHSVGHDRHQRLRDNGRKTDGIDFFDFRIRSLTGSVNADAENSK